MQLLEEALVEMVELQSQRGGVAAPRGPPPASKEAVARLPLQAVTEEVLATLSADTQCAVCREELQLGNTVQVMPCSSMHVFHPQCLKPWLDQHNSCPVCRFELPTDDAAYESHKAREAAVEEERCGAANAVREGQFMYL